MHQQHRQLTRSIVSAALVSLAATSCAGNRIEVPLFDALHPPLVLSEEERLELPPSQQPNRFVSGWRDVRRSKRGAPALKAVGRGRLQFVRLASRPRTLHLDLAQVRTGDVPVELRFNDGAWQRRSLESAATVPIPADLQPGRSTLDLRPVEDSRVVLRSVKLSDARPGEAELRGSDLIQQGDVIVEVVRRLNGESSLRGSLQPPSQPVPGQAFHVEVETAERLERRFSWIAGEAGDFDFDVPLPPAEFVRIRLLAEGAVEPGRWRNLTLVTPSATELPEPDAPEALPELVVLYIMDALRADHVGHLGGRAGISPNIDRLASEGATFSNHFSVAPNTVPSTKSLLTGNRYLVHGGSRLSEESGPTLAERFSRAGFIAALFSSNGNVGNFRGMARGYVPGHTRVLQRSNGARRRAGYNNSAEFLQGEALAWLDEATDASPAFLHVQTVNPHNPYDPPDPFRRRFVPDNGSEIDARTRTLKAIRRQRRTVGAEDRERLRGLYAASVAYNDAALGEFLEELDRRYEPGEVLFILTSDHGEELFDHGGVLHGYTLYDEMLHIPLVIRWLGVVEPGTVIRGLTDTVDLHATLAALVDADSTANGGESLWPALQGERAPEHGKDMVFAAASSLDGLFMARSERYKVVSAPRGGQRWGMGQGLGRGFDPEYVFALDSDPSEMRNLAGSRNLEADWLRQQLAAWVEIGRQLEAGDEVDEMDEATRESLEALGYL